MQAGMDSSKVIITRPDLLYGFLSFQQHLFSEHRPFDHLPL